MGVAGRPGPVDPDRRFLPHDPRIVPGRHAARHPRPRVERGPAGQLDPQHTGHLVAGVHLREELGVPPSPQTRQLVSLVRAGQAGRARGDGLAA